MSNSMASPFDDETAKYGDTRLGGVICPIITPFDENERVDHIALQRLLSRVVPHVDGIMALGSTGEFPLLDPAVADEVVNGVTEALPDGPRLIVGVGDAGTAKALKNLRRVTPRVDNVAVCSPYYYPVEDPKALCQHYLKVADVAPAPVLLYNIPQNTHLSLPLQVVEELAEHENIQGIKDSSGDILYFQHLLELRRPSFSVLQGADEHLVSICLRAGSDGYVAGIENVIPGTVRALYRAIVADDDTLADQLQQRINGAVDATRNGFWLAGLKAAVAMIDGGTGRTAEPIAPATDLQRATIRDALAKLGIEPSCGSRASSKT